MDWNTACLDWEERLLSGRPLVPDLPLFKAEAQKAVRVFNRLRIPDVEGKPKFEDAIGPWFRDIVAALFGSYDRASRRRMISELFLLIPKKNCKALALDTLIATPGGFTTMRDVQTGEQVLSVAGKPTRVVGKSHVFVGRPCFEVKFSSGETVVCDAEHLWMTDAHRDRAKRKTRTRDDRSQPCPSAKETREIAATLKVPSGRYAINNHRTALCASLDLPEADLPIPPYVLGYWLGNGASAAANVTTGLPDVSHVAAQIAAVGHSVRVLERAQTRGAARLSIAEPGATGVKLPYRFLSVAGELGLVKNKHIPACYLRASRGQRLALLRGLMDSDGSVSARGQAVFCTTSPLLRDDTRELINSLGYKATVSEHRAMLQGRDCGPKWNVQFWPFAGDESIATLARKAERAKENPTRVARSRCRQIVDVRPVASVPVQCIEVDDASKQYLVTRSLIPTHNSTGAAGVMVTAAIINRRPAAEFVLIAPTKEIADISYKQASGMITADPDLAKLFHQQHHIRTITNRRTEAQIKIKAADTDVITGGKQTGTLIDETHVFAAHSRAREVFVEARGALAARPDGFLVQITTQSKSPPAGVFKDELTKARAVRDGKRQLPLLPVLYELPERLVKDGAWKDRKYWPLVNPNLGRSVDPAFLEREMQSAEDTGLEQLTVFASQHLNVEIGVGLRSDRWAGADHWQAAAMPGLTLDTLIERCEVIVAGVDGGGLDDLLGFVALGREKETRRWLLWAQAWAHECVLERRKEIAPRLRDFETEGTLRIVADDSSEDIDDVVELIRRIDEAGLLPEKYAVGVDPAGITDIIDALELAGFDTDQEQARVAAIRQGSISLNNTVKTAERRLAAKDILHGGTALMAWVVGNAKVEMRGNAVTITKQSAGVAKIDPLMAAFNAVALMVRNPEARGPSVYESEDVFM